MTKIIRTNLWFCQDCLHGAVNNDYTGLDYYLEPEQAEQRMKVIKAGLQALNGHPVPNDKQDDFSRVPCDCCGEKLHGERYGFNLLK